MGYYITEADDCDGTWRASRDDWQAALKVADGIVTRSHEPMMWATGQTFYAVRLVCKDKGIKLEQVGP